MLTKIIVFDYKLKLLSGLHIGGSADIFDIGGADSTVIKNPLTHQPYIPGSSMKGKLRSLLTLIHGKLITDRGKFDLVIEDTDLLNLFEPTGKEGDIQISRAIFRDAVLTEESVKMLEKYLGKNTFTEIKAENKISPFKGKAEDPRFIERVPAGAVFRGQVILQIFDGDNEEKMKETLMNAFEMLENNFIGGSGTRGYGRIEVQSSSFQEVWK